MICRSVQAEDRIEKEDSGSRVKSKPFDAYPLRHTFPGLDIAARSACRLTVARAIPIAVMPAKTKNQALGGIRQARSCNHRIAR